LNHDNCDLCTNHQEKDIIYLDEEDEDFINKNDIWKHTNICPEQEEDTQSNDGAFITITMAKLEEEKRKM
jgi:hypothetical protein